MGTYARGMLEASPARPTFCTVVDLHYLPRALALYRSLEEFCPSFGLHIVCMEPGVRRSVERLRLRHATAHDIGELEAADAGLRAVKDSRNRAEYCWTVKPPVCLYLLAAAITYLDSDLMFFDDPGLLLDELGDGSVLLLPHRFPSERPEWAELDGIFNGGWLTFRADGRALKALHWWRERCLEWCYDRRENGKFADQHYLDDWPERFDGVHVIEHPGAGVAPWNASTHELTRADGSLFVNGRPLVFYHYQSLRLLRAPPALRRLTLRSHGYRFTSDPVRQLWWTAPGYALSERTVELLYPPYLGRLLEALAELRAADPDFQAGLTRLTPDELRRQVARRLLPGPFHRVLRQMRLREQA
jgi:hypothetical protein